jgi:hypothetical protein
MYWVFLPDNGIVILPFSLSPIAYLNLPCIHWVLSIGIEFIREITYLDLRDVGNSSSLRGVSGAFRLRLPRMGMVGVAGGSTIAPDIQGPLCSTLPESPSSAPSPSPSSSLSLEESSSTVWTCAVAFSLPFSLPLALGWTLAVTSCFSLAWLLASFCARSLP